MLPKSYHSLHTQLCTHTHRQSIRQLCPTRYTLLLELYRIGSYTALRAM
jgi:hypothetical protein